MTTVLAYACFVAEVWYWVLQGLVYSRNPQVVQGQRRDRFDYAERVDSISSLSTPNSAAENPFAKEELGDTVIHLDKVLFRSLCVA